MYFWEPYCKSDNFAIRYHSKVITGQIYGYSPFMETSVLQLEKHDVDLIIDFLSEISTSDKHEISKFGCTFSTKEFLSGVKCLLYNSINADNLIKSNVLTILIGLIVAGYPVEKREALLVMWKLANLPSFMGILNSLDLPLMDTLSELEVTEDTDLKLLISGLLSCVDNSKSLFGIQHLVYLFISATCQSV